MVTDGSGVPGQHRDPGYRWHGPGRKPGNGFTGCNCGGHGDSRCPGGLELHVGCGAPGGRTTATAVAADAAGNASPSSTARSFTVDTIAPLPPTVVTPAEGAVLLVGTPSFSGSAEAGSTVKVWVDDTEAGTVTGGPLRNLESPSVRASRRRCRTRVRAAATDNASNNSPVSAPRSFTVELARGCGCAERSFFLQHGTLVAAALRTLAPAALRDRSTAGGGLAQVL